MARPAPVLDELLVLAAQDGEARAWDQLVRRWHGRLWRHARNMTGCNEAAGDVSQEAWVGILKRLRTLEDPAAFPGWAYRIVTRRAADWVRQQARRRQHTKRLPDVVPASDSNPHPADLEARDQARVVREALQRLPVDHRAILSMHYLSDLSTAQIAEALDIPRGTVKSRMHSARQRLRTLLETEGHQP